MRQWIVPVLLLAPIGCGGGSTSPAVAQTGERGEVQPLEAAGVHNLFRVSDRVYSGSTPDGDAGFAALERLGVKTIISVDGARPDAEAAARHGIRYVHLPFGYDGIPRDKAVALVRVARDSPGPVYVHCHHGKHRGPAAVAIQSTRRVLTTSNMDRSALNLRFGANLMAPPGISKRSHAAIPEPDQAGILCAPRATGASTRPRRSVRTWSPIAIQIWPVARKTIASKPPTISAIIAPATP